MVDIAAMTALIKEAVELSKRLGEVIRKAGSRELRAQLDDLQDKLLAFSTSLPELTAENQTLRKRVAELERTDEVEREMRYEDPVYWRVRDGNKIDGPFCRSCWDARRKVVHVRSTLRGRYYCETCRQEIVGPIAESSFGFVSAPSPFKEPF